VTLYKVTAATGFRGHKLGDEFEADLDPAQEQRAKERGSIRVVKRDDDKPRKEKASNG
jgi:hypothetical protein